MTSSISFKDLSQHLKPYLLTILTDISSGGSQQGREYKAASIYGGKGDSFSFNIDTQKWADFAVNGHQGGDIISLYATIKGVKQFEAAKQLADQYGYQLDNSVRSNTPSFIHYKFGKPDHVYMYKNAVNEPTHAVVKYLLKETNSKGKQKKQFSQWHYNLEENKWVNKTTPVTPLYKLDLIHAYQNKKVVICEGEKSAEAAQLLLGNNHYVTTCWMGGATTASIKKCDLSPLIGREVYLWADNDQSGFEAMGFLSQALAQTAKSITLINPKPSDPDTFDAADLLELGLSSNDLKDWLKSRITILKPSLSPAEVLSPQTANVEPRLNEGPTIPTLQVVSGDDQLTVFDQARASIKWEQYGLQMKSQYKVFENEANVYAILEKSPLFSKSFYYDVFFQSFMSTYESKEPEKVTKDLITNIKIHLQKQFYFGNVSTEAVKNAVGLFLSKAPKNNYMAEKIKSYKWDNKPRINSFMTEIYGSDPSDYTTAVSRIFWLQMVKRIVEPGCQADIVVILEGEQGIKKTSSLRVIGGDYYAPAGKELNKDFYIKLKGKFLMEIGELSTFSKSDHNDLKEMISTNNDFYRDLFQPDDTPHPRSCIFVGTTNDKYYLKDETGNRRYLPIDCKKVELDNLKENLEQYFAEAYLRLQSGEDHWEYPKEAQQLITDQRSADLKDDDPWADDIAKWVFDVKKVLVKSIMIHALGIHDARFHTKKEANRIGKILKNLGFEHGKVSIDKAQQSGWISSRTDCLYSNCAEKTNETPEQKIRRLEQEIVKVKQNMIFG